MISVYINILIYISDSVKTLVLPDENGDKPEQCHYRSVVSRFFSQGAVSTKRPKAPTATGGLEALVTDCVFRGTHGNAYYDE